MLAAQLVALASSLTGLLVLLANLRRLVPAEAYPSPERLPRVSVLVPARDEERDIETCVRSLLAQDYPGEYEVVVLDDGSTDGTRTILDGLAADERLRVLEGTPLPAGWLGKPWACRQLAEAATGERLVFTDADTFHGAHSVLAGISDAEAQDADMLTGLPHVDTLTLGEALVLPFIPWSMATLLPLPVAYRLRWPWLSTANGQYIVFRREAYEAVGGHGAVRDQVLEDTALARLIKSAGLRWRITDVSDLVSTRMYRNLREIFQGLGKNLFGLFDYGLLRFLAIGVLFTLVFLLPPAVLAAAALARPLPGASVPLAVLTWAVTTTAVFIGYRRLDYPPALALLYPVTMLLVAAVGLWSLGLALFARRSWKGRPLDRVKLRWL